MTFLSAGIATSLNVHAFAFLFGYYIWPSCLFLLLYSRLRTNLSTCLFSSTSPTKPLFSFRSPSLFYLLAVGVEVVHFNLITLRHTPQSVRLLWTRDRPDAETST
jgi:hypothetical protein